MRILIADKLSPTAVQALEAIGATVIFEPDLGADDLPSRLGDIEILIVRSTKVTADAINAAPGLSLIVRAGAGVNTIDCQAASSRGIYVANCPGKNADAVSELAIGLLIAADRRIADATADLRSGKWRKKEYGKAAGLKGRTLGVLGLGTIGKGVIERAKALQMRVCAWSRSLTPELAEELDIIYAPDPAAVARASDAVTIHLAKTAETTHLVNAAFLAEMKPGAILVNTSRGELVDTAALQAAIVEKKLRVALDVFENEPSSGDTDFADTELAGSIACTPHIGASTGQASEAIAEEAVRVVKEFKQTGKAPNTVNLCARTPATHQLVVRHYNRVGVLASIFEGLRTDGINVEEMENTIFDGANAASATLLLDGAPSEETIKSIEENENVLHAGLHAR